MREACCPARLIAALLVAAAVCAALLLPATAFATTTLTAVTPADGGTVSGTWNPAVTVQLASDATLSPSVGVMIDSRLYTLRVNYATSGYMDWSSGSPVWVVTTDPTRGSAYLTCPPLSPGAHAIMVSASDLAGGTLNRTTGFTLVPPAVLGAPSPGPGSVVATDMADVSVPIDPRYVPQVSFTVDGRSVSWSLDAAGSRIRAARASLSNLATHSVAVTWFDGAGRTQALSWSFTTSYTCSTQIINLLPGEGAVLTDPTSVYFAVTDPVGVSGAAELYLDGAQVAVTTQAVSARAMKVLSASPLVFAEGTHTLSAVAHDSRGGMTSRAWSVRGASPLRIAALSPAEGEFVGTSTPVLAVPVVSGAGSVSGTFTLDGAPYPGTFDAASGLLAARVSVPLPDESRHTLSVTVTDASAKTLSATTHFTVRTYTTGPSAACVVCHSNFPAAHRVANCDACHHHGAFYGQRCTVCHGARAPHDSTKLLRALCTDCHGVGDPYVPEHPLDVGPLHVSATDVSSCSCHDGNLTVEHPRHKDAGGVPLGCATCHGAAASTQVRAAVTAHDTRCSACHTLAGSGHQTMHESSIASQIDPASGATCAGCHDTNLVTEHARPRSSSAAAGCTNCHPTPRGAVVGAWDKTCVTGPCHQPASAAAMHGGVDAAHQATATVTASCTRNCHLADLRAEHARRGPGRTPVTCVACHAAKVAPMTGPWNGTCTACHATPHYSGAKAGNGDCLECHGTTGQAGMSAVGTSGAFANTGGDHAGTAVSAHGAVAAGNVGGVSTGIACEACHSHLSADTTRHVDYRTSSLAVSATAQAQLCYGCHSASGAETLTAGTRPYTWNGRDVKAEFARASHHPVSAPPRVLRDETVTVLAQDTQAAFALDTLSQVSNLDDEGPQLAYGTVMASPPPNQRMLFLVDRYGRFSQFDVAKGVWNDDAFDPPDAGGDAYAIVAAEGKVYSWGKAPEWPFNQCLRAYTLPNVASPGSWSTLSNAGSSGYTYQQFPYGADIAYDSLHHKLYFTRGQSSSTLYVWDIPTGTRTDLDIRSAEGVSMPQSTGAALAFSPQMDALYLLSSDPSVPASQGMLYRIDGLATATSVATATPVIRASRQGTGSANYRMTRVTRGGKDTLYVLGTCVEHVSPSLMAIGNLDTTPTRLTTHQWPFGTWGDQLENSDIEFDDQDNVWVIASQTYGMYGIPGGFLTAVVPPDPATTGLGWNSRALLSSFLGGAMAFATATPPAQPASGFPATGRLTSPEIAAPADLVRWGTLTYAAEVPAGTGVAAGVEGFDGTAWTALAAPQLDSTTLDLTGVDASVYRRIRVHVDLTTSDFNITPHLTSWSATGVLRRQGAQETVTRTDAVALMQAAPSNRVFSSAVVGTGGPVTNGATTVWDPAADRRLAFLCMGGPSASMIQYDPGTGTYNGFNYDPADLVSPGAGAGASLFTADNTVCVGIPVDIAGKAQALQYQPPARGATLRMALENSSWYFDNTPDGGSAYDPVHKVAYVYGQRNPGEQPGLFRWSFANGTPVATNTLNADTWGWRDAIAFAPGADKLFATHYSSTELFSINNPSSIGTSAVGEAVAATGTTGGNVNSSNTRIALFGAGATEYLAVAGYDKNYSLDIRIVSGLNNATQTVVTVPRWPSNFTGSSTYPYWAGSYSMLGYSPALVWDGGSYLYLLQGSNSINWARIAIPATPTVAANWGAWSALPNLPSLPGLGAGLTFADATGLQQQYYPAWVTESIVASEVVARAGDSAWGTLTVDATMPAGTSVGSTVQFYNGAAWVNSGVVNAAGSAFDLSAYSTAAYPRARAVFQLTPAGTHGTTRPTVQSWSISTGWGKSTCYTDAALPPRGADRWATVGWDAYVPAGGAMTVNVQGWNGSAWADVPGFTGLTARSIDLSTLSVSTWSKLRLLASMTTVNKGDDPRFIRVWFTSSVPRTGPATSLTCASCHGPHSVTAGGPGGWDMARVSDPANTKSGFSGTATQFCLACHSQAASPASRFETTAIVPYDVQVVEPVAPYFTGLDKAQPRTAYSGSAHATAAVGRTGCENCHDPHGSDNAALTAWSLPSWFAGGPAGTRANSVAAAGGRNLCFNCHGNGVTGATAPGAPDVATPMTQAYGHAAGATGKHADTESVLGVGASNRHAECVDCHDAHAAAAGVHATGTSNPGGALRGATGVRPVYASATDQMAAPASYQTVRISGRSTEREAYVCFKCHSGATSLPDTGGSGGFGASDLAAEFNPANVAYHDVLGTGRGVLTKYTVDGSEYVWPWVGTMVNGWATNSKMTCSDCHTGTSLGKARGPHGSSVKFGLDPAYPADWETAGIDFSKTSGMSQNIICAKCHQLQDRADGVHGSDYYTGNIHTVSYRPDITCNTCHMRVPHGWKRPRMLGYTTDPAPYRSTGLTGVRLRSRPTGWWQTTDCQASCTSFGDHRQGGPYWP